METERACSTWNLISGDFLQWPRDTHTLTPVPGNQWGAGCIRPSFRGASRAYCQHGRLGVIRLPTQVRAPKRGFPAWETAPVIGRGSCGRPSHPRAGSRPAQTRWRGGSCSRGKRAAKGCVAALSLPAGPPPVTSHCPGAFQPAHGRPRL